MFHARPAMLLLGGGFFLSLTLLHAQSALSIQGTVTDRATNQTIPAAIVIATNTSIVPWTSAQTNTAQDGSFSFSNLSAGTHRLCIQVPGGGYLDPCTWSPTAPSVTLAPGKPVTGLALPISKGSTLKVRLDDPKGLANSDLNQGRGLAAQLSVQTPLGFSKPLVLRGKDNQGSDHEVTVPFDTAVKVSVSSPKFTLADGNGSALAAGFSQAQTHSSTAAGPPQTIVLQITGLK